MLRALSLLLLLAGSSLAAPVPAPLPVNEQGCCTGYYMSIAVTTGTSIFFGGRTREINWIVSGDTGGTAYVYASLTSLQDAAADKGDSAGYLTFGSGASTFAIAVAPIPLTNLEICEGFWMYFCCKPGARAEIHMWIESRKHDCSLP